MLKKALLVETGRGLLHYFRLLYHAPVRVIGIDPGLATVGIGIIDATSAYDLTVVEWLTINTAAGLPLAERLKEIFDDLDALLRDLQPDLAVVEKLFFATNVKTAMDVAHARGAILLALSRHALPLMEPTPLQLKLSITGDGNADKIQMQTMLLHLLRLKEIPRPDDAADALGLAAYGALTTTYA